MRSDCEPKGRVLMIVLAYLGPAAIVPMVLHRHVPGIREHAIAGLRLFGAQLLFWSTFQLWLRVAGPGLPLAIVAAVGAILFVVLHVIAIANGIDKGSPMSYSLRGTASPPGSRRIGF